MIFLGSALFNACFWLWTFLFGLVCLPGVLVYQPFAYTVSRTWSRGILWMLRAFCGLTFEVRGANNIPQGSVIIASKHQSAWETIMFWGLLRRPTYVLKRELLFFPVFGIYLMLLRCIWINRSAGAGALKKMLKQGTARAKENRPIVIFPEGTRSPVGAATTYHPGVAALYNHLKVPVVPVAVNSGLYWAKNAFIKTPGTIVVEFLPPIAPGMKNRDFMETLKTRIDTASLALSAPAARP